jgi:hypothetical protein
MPQLQEP